MTMGAFAQLGQSTHRPHGWLVSCLLHGMAFSASILLFTELKPPLQAEPFRWEIALAQVTPQATPPAMAEPPAPAPSQPEPVIQPDSPSPVKPVEASPVTRHLQTVQKVEPVQQVVRQQEVVQPRTNPIVESVTLNAEPIHQNTQLIQATEAVQTPSVEAEAAPTPISPIVETESSTVTAGTAPESPDPVVTHEAIVTRSTPETSPHANTETASAESVVPIQQVAHAAIGQPQKTELPAPVAFSTKADYTWLTEELLSRLQGSKRYPYAARMNRWEGKVIVRAVIRDDGQVVSLQIAQSSGHAVLDDNAMELIRQVSPIQLKYPLGKNQIALLVPVGYSLH